MRLGTGTATVAIAVAGLAALPVGAAANGFKYGVTASEVTPTSALLWTRADKKGAVLLEVSRDRKFGNKDDKRKRLKATSAADNTVQARVTGLRAGQKYIYRFGQGTTRASVAGTFKTAPKPSQAKTITFAYSGDADAQRAIGASNPFYNTFQVYKQMAKQGNDFNINFGDTIYSDTEVGSRDTNGVFTPAQPTALTVKAKWAKYKQNLALKNLQLVRGSAGMYNHWDDHEFINDFSKAENGATVYKAGVTAFRDYMPVTYKPSTGIYRSFSWGKNADLFFLDERSFRDSKAAANHVCDNPDTQAPDLAPTAPQRVRNIFAVITPSLARPVSQACLDTIRDPNRTFLGNTQLTDFMNRLKASKAKFKIVMNETPIQQFYALPYDRWEGYEAERQKLLRYIQANVKNVVFLTTDTHANLYNDARLSTFPEEGGTVDSGINEMVTGPVATMTFAKEISTAAGSQNAGDLVTSAFFKQPPPNGPGMVCAATDVFSYTEVKVTSTALTLTPKDLNGKLVHEKGSNGAQGPACGPFTIPAK
jgi:phosphodiesterase/alkaline phosphatase D-like protein